MIVCGVCGVFLFLNIFHTRFLVQMAPCTLDMALAGIS